MKLFTICLPIMMIDSLSGEAVEFVYYSAKLWRLKHSPGCKARTNSPPDRKCHLSAWKIRFFARRHRPGSHKSGPWRTQCISATSSNSWTQTQRFWTCRSLHILFAFEGSLLLSGKLPSDDKPGREENSKSHSPCDCVSRKHCFDNYANWFKLSR